VKEGERKGKKEVKEEQREGRKEGKKKCWGNSLPLDMAYYKW
jgi:hypothetical protein